MELFKTIVLVVFALVAFKSIIGYRFPWEPTVRARKALEGNLGPTIYNAMYGKENNQDRADAAEAAVRKLLKKCELVNK